MTVPAVEFGKTVVVGGTPSTQAFGDAAADGGSNAAADLLHKHGLPAAFAISSVGGTFTRNVATTGNWSLTGFGFQPKLIFFYATNNSVGIQASWSVVYLTAHQMIFTPAAGFTAGTYDGNPYALWFTSGASVYAFYPVISLDSDGVTFSTNQSGSPTGTIYGQYRAFTW